MSTSAVNLSFDFLLFELFPSGWGGGSWGLVLGNDMNNKDITRTQQQRDHETQ